MSQAHKYSFLVLLALIFLLPIFFIPGGALYLESAKTALLLLGIITASAAFLFEVWQGGKLSFPKHYFLAAAAALPLVYLLSALLSTPTSLSLFGYGFEVGTFGYMLLGSAALLLSATIFTDTSKALQALTALFVSLSLIAVFAALKIWGGGDFLALGNFRGNMGNPVGNWTDLALIFGLLSVFTSLVLGMIPMRLGARAILYAVFILSTVLLVIVNFFIASVLTLSASILLFFYFKKIEKNFHFSSASKESRGISRPVLLPVILGLISLLLIINPTISQKRGALGNVIAKTFNIENTEVRPSFSATLDISKAVLSQGALLGSGPNTFSHDWLIYKPAGINATPFWSVAFPFGAGFVPTQIASTGILGSTLWLFFFVLLIALAIKALTHIPESRVERFVIILSLLVSFFLWAASFFYAPSGTVLMLAFIFSGLFAAGVVPVHIINFKESPQKHFAAAFTMGVIVLASLTLGWIGFNKTASAYHWKRAIDLSNTAGVSLVDVENELTKAINRAPADIYYVALSRLNFSKAQIAANAVSTSSPQATQENRAVFENSVAKSIEAAKLAVSTNQAGYQNWAALGMVYSALVQKPLSIEGAYENALFAYNEALKRNPANPELYLFLAQLGLNKEDAAAARSFIRNAIALKDDYTDAYLMLAQLEVKAGNTLAAIASAEKLSLLVPNNPALYFELGLLKYSNKDYAGAEKSLNQAVMLSPEYANAKYYLGLTLANLGRKDETKALFEKLLIANPDNKELKQALKNLK